MVSGAPASLLFAHSGAEDEMIAPVSAGSPAAAVV